MNTKSAFKFELVTFVPWSNEGLHDEILYGSGLGADGSPLMVLRIPPDLLRGPDGTLWLTAKGRIVRTGGNNGAEVFPLLSADMDIVTSKVPTLDKGVVLLGRTGAEYVLARLTNKGELAWRVKNVPLLQGNIDHAQLLVDFDGIVYLYIARREGEGGRLVHINLTDGISSVVFEFAQQEHLPERIWVRQGRLFWIDDSAGTCSWVSRNLETGYQSAITAHSSIQPLLATACAALPDGGALLTIPEDGELIWMGADGSESGRLAMVGVVRANGELAAAVREGDGTTITRWRKDQVLESFQVGQFPVPMNLIYADQNVYYFLDREQIVAVDSTGERVSEIPDYMVGEQRLQREGSISIANAVVDPEGAVLLVGADADGTYVVKVTNAK